MKIKFILFPFIIYFFGCSVFNYKKEEKPKNSFCTENSVNLHFGYENYNFGARKDQIPEEGDFSNFKSELEKNCIFKTVLMNSESSDYHLELIYKYNTNIDLIFFYMTMITTFLIPYYGNMDLSLEIELENTKTKGKWKSNYEVFQRVWIHPLLILTAPFLNPITIREKAMKNLNYKIISDLEKSGVIK